MSEKKIRSIAKEMGYSIRKTGKRYLQTGKLVRDCEGNIIPGYTVTDHRLGCFVWGSFNELFCGLWSWEDCERFVLNMAKEA